MRAQALVMLSMLVPALMASEGWDDHSRAHRRTGVDFAKNYLDSLQPNAICLPTEITIRSRCGMSKR